jgi:hypothetical protein
MLLLLPLLDSLAWLRVGSLVRLASAGAAGLVVVVPVLVVPVFGVTGVVPVVVGEVPRVVLMVVESATGRVPVLP